MHIPRAISKVYTQERQPSLLLLVATMLGYILLGGVSLSLAISPNYASPVFPAAGLALVVALYFGPRILPAIWLGSCILNLVVAIISRGDFSFSHLWMSAGMATGSTIQAWCGRTLVQYWLQEKWRILESERDIFRFLFIAGPLVCAISASISTICLLSSGLMQTSEWPFGWWNWYVGDTLGVLLFAPFLVGWLHRKNKPWSGRLKTITIPTIVMLIMASMTFLSVSQWEHVNLRKDMKAHGEKLTRIISNHIVALQEILTSLASFIEVTPNMNATQFNQFTKTVLAEHPDIAALSYNLLLPDSQRQAFESEIAHRYPGSEPHIMERNAQGILAPAPRHADYVVVAFISPIQGNAQAIGFNINAEMTRHNAIQRSRRTNLPAATAQIHLVQDKQNKQGILVLTPVLSQNPESAKKQPSGFAVAVFKVDELINIATQGMLTPGIELDVTDPNAAPEDQLLYSSQTPKATTISPYNWHTSISIADRKWDLNVYPDTSYIQANRSIQAWSTGLIGLLITSMFQIILFGITGRNNLIQRQVENQTDQLREKNAALSQSEARYASVVNNVKEVVFQTDTQGLWTFLNPAWTEVSGFPVASSIGTSFLDYVYPEDRQRNQALFVPLIERKKDYCRHEVRYVHKNGDFRWLEVFARLTFDDKDMIIGTSGTLTDITERRMLEQRLQLASIAFTHGHDGIIITAPDTTILDVNDAFTAITGFHKDEVIGQQPQIFKHGQHNQSFSESFWHSLNQNGEWHGELWCQRKNGEAYLAMINISKVLSHDGQVQNYIGLFSDITLLRKQQEQLEYIAHYDPLTNLPNRLLMTDRLHQAMAQALRRNNDLFVAYIDLDGFKQINDQFGHATGDLVLKEVATNMKQVLREGDTLSRIGGDEFIAVILDIKDINPSLQLLNRILIAAAQPIIVNDQKLQVSASIGVTFYPQKDKVDVEQLLSQADQAMYQAKLEGKNQYKIFKYNN